ncbi:MAG: nucleotide exchange factor GrpE [Treponema sp.]|nr:nucleotide exchange factor GrpE [Treponema sp.]
MSEETEKTEETQGEEIKSEAVSEEKDAETVQVTEDEDGAEEGATDKEPTADEKIAALEKENAELKEQLLRRAADFDNYRKRMIKEKQDAYDYANANLLGDLLESLDNFDRTIEAAKDAKNAKSIADGIKMINKALVKMLEEKYNLSSFGKEKEAFNPDLHEALRSENGKVAEPEIKEVYLKGYKLKERVIRHAKVSVIMPE